MILIALAILAGWGVGHSGIGRDDDRDGEIVDDQARPGDGGIFANIGKTLNSTSRVKRGCGCGRT